MKNKYKIKVIVLIIIMIISILGIILTIKNSISISNINMSNEVIGNYKIFINLFVGLFSLSFLYLIMSIKNKNFYKIKDKLIIYILSNTILITSLIIGLTHYTNYYLLNSKHLVNDKEKISLDKSNIVSDNYINLDEIDTDITINKGGTYTFTGSFNHSLIVDANDEEVEIILNGVNITNNETASIIGLSAGKINITLSEGTNNILSDGGNSIYDGCIFSNAILEFSGEGTLYINGNQKEGEGIATEAKNIIFNSGTYIIKSNDDGINAGGDGASIIINDGVFYIDASGDGIDSNKDAIINGGNIFVMGSDTGGDSGIDTDEGYTINGGTLVAIGSDMIETPLETSLQKSLSFILDETISKDTIVTLMKNDEVIVSFTASKSFKTIIISSDELDEGSYSLYTSGSNDGELVNGIYVNGTYTKGNKVTINNNDTFEVSSIVNLYGKKER